MADKVENDGTLSPPAENLPVNNSVTTADQTEQKASIEDEASDSNKLKTPPSTETYRLSPQPSGGGSKPNGKTATEDKDRQTASSAAVVVSKTPAHKLHNRWSFSYQRDWNNPIHEILDFDTVEQFWGLWNNIVVPSRMTSKGSCMLFKHGINPTWEAAENKKGGQWMIEVRDKALDDAWLYMLLGLIGETFTDADSLCGAYLKVRSREKAAKVALWISTQEELTVKRIGEELQKFTEAPANLVYNSTDEIVNKVRKGRYRILAAPKPI
eukprot:gb/GEZN01010247.1/.p1 GENE.gb/GEZN01010247.1/~~gb/GEZN01010247.1/.p1  ORF type:complete len:278 (+),score=27.95 gb/GEZN01010247.1/:30-836(+)